jgi:hypothetical protein
MGKMTYTTGRAKRHTLLLVALCALLLVSGCGARTPVVAQTTGTAAPAPTVAAFFRELPTMTPRPATTATPRPTAASAAPDAASANPTPDRTDPTAGLEVLPVYADSLSAGWSLTNSIRVSPQLRSAAHVFEGRYALEARATGDFATLYFTLNRGSGQMLLRDSVVGLRFQLSGGDIVVDNDNLAVTVVGSNAQPYWVANDSSVELEGRVTEELPLFSETRLYFLGIDTSIPAGEWGDVVLWLDEREFDPDYTYVTGFYIKNEDLSRFYIDNVELLLLPETAD